MSTMHDRLDARVAALLPADYATARRIADQATRKAVEPPIVPTASGELEPFTCGRIDDKWIDQELAIQDAQNRSVRRRGVLLSLAKEANERAASIYQRLTSHILAAYQEELTLLLAEVKQLATVLDGIDTPAEAIADDHGHNGSSSPNSPRTTRLCVAPNEPRCQRMRSISAAPVAGGDDHASDLYLKNLDELWPNWRTPQLDASRYIDMSGTRPPRRLEPWPADPVQLCLWLVTSNAQPWIPTPAQLAQLQQRRQDTANPNPVSPPQNPRIRLNGGQGTDYMNKPIAVIKSL